MLVYFMKELAQHIQTLIGVRLKSSQIKAFEEYEHLLLEWNARMNLTAIREPGDIRVKHFLDSLTCLKVMKDTPSERLVDVGTGAGFPGLPLKIICPGMRVTLIESVGKKADFCQRVASALNLEGVEVVQDRAEVSGHAPEHREKYDWAVARAVAALPALAEYLLPFVKIGGRMLAMKGESAVAEAHSAENALYMLGGHLRQVVPVTLPGVADERYLVVVDKTAATPHRYPRRVGLPSKKPL
jgi:16S rRNA (guanine527-N7)-methyltransferase